MANRPGNTYFSKKSGLKAKEKRFQNQNGLYKLLSNAHTIVPFLSSILQIKAGFVLIFISVLGLFEPGWITALFSFLGSLLFMMGGILLYHTISRLGSFDDLISGAIRRVIQSQN